MKKATKNEVINDPSPVVIATIGYTKYCLSTLEDGQKLVELLAKAQHVSNHHKLPSQKQYYKTERTGDLEVSLVYTEIIDEKEAEKLIEITKTAA